MASAAEAMGMTLTGSSSFPADHPEKLQECASIGAAMRNLLEKNILPRHIMTRSAFENAIVSDTVSKNRLGYILMWLVGIDDDLGRIDKRSFTPDSRRPFCWHQTHPRRLPSCLRSYTLYRGLEAQRKVCHGGRLQAWRHS